MHLPDLFSLDFVNWWKAASILLTGFFGILGLVTEFKNPTTRRITKWGFLSLIGILVSMTLGAYSQLLETADQNDKRAEEARRALQLLLSSQQTLNGIQRTLSILGEPTAWASFRITCQEEMPTGSDQLANELREYRRQFLRFCKAAEPFNKAGGHWPERVWKLWPTGIRGYFVFNILITRVSQAAALEADLESRGVLWLFGDVPKSADWHMEFVAAHSPESTEAKLVRATGFFGGLEGLNVEPESEVKPFINVNNGKLKSFLDLNNTYLYVTSGLDGTEYRPNVLKLSFPNGRSLDFGGSDFEFLGNKNHYFRAKIKAEP
jgi:hypothetical protein